MTTRLGFFKGVDIASASAITAGPNGTYHDVTGTTTINSIASKRAGSIVLFRIISGGLKFQHLTGTLNMRGKVDFTSVDGDLIEFVSEGAGQWTEINRSSSAGSLLVGFEAPALIVLAVTGGVGTAAGANGTDGATTQNLTVPVNTTGHSEVASNGTDGAATIGLDVLINTIGVAVLDTS